MNLSTLRSLLIFGGTFDPPHVAHITLPQIVRKTLGLQAVAYVPAARPPHKLDQQQTPAHHRLAMLRLALADQPHTLILTDELDRADTGKPSYTIDTLESLKTRLPESAVMRLLIGVDQLLIFDKWKSALRIEQLAEPVVMLRPPHTRESVLDRLPPDQQSKWSARLIDVPPMDISSTAIRDRLAKHQSVDELLPSAVIDYIHVHHLYGT